MMAYAGRLRYLLHYLLSLAMILVGVLAGFQYDWPDFVHTDYGFPFVWATHTTVTIIGPVDQWRVSLANLALNVAIWLAISYIVSIALLRTARPAAKVS